MFALFSEHYHVLFLQVSVYTVPEKINQAEYALNTAVTLLDFYDDYFGIPYPLPKQGKHSFWVRLLYNRGRLPQVVKDGFDDCHIKSSILKKEKWQITLCSFPLRANA